MPYKLFTISLLTLAMSSCSASSPTEDDVKEATNQLFKAFKTTPVETVSNLKCNKTNDASSFKCSYTTTMIDEEVLESVGIFSHSKGKWERTN